MLSLTKIKNLYRKKSSLKRRWKLYSYKTVDTFVCDVFTCLMLLSCNENKIMMKPDDTSKLYIFKEITERNNMTELDGWRRKGESKSSGRDEDGKRLNKSLFKLENPSLSCMNEAVLVFSFWHKSSFAFTSTSNIALSH